MSPQEQVIYVTKKEKIKKEINIVTEKMKEEKDENNIKKLR